MKKNKLALIAGGIVILGVAGYFIFRKKKPSVTTPPLPTPTPTPTPTPIPDGEYGGYDTGGGDSGTWTNPGFYGSYTQFKVKTSGSNLNVRNTASTSGSIVSSLSNGATIFARPSSTSGWHEYSKDGSTRFGYVSSQYIQAV